MFVFTQRQLLAEFKVYPEKVSPESSDISQWKGLKGLAIVKQDSEMIGYFPSRTRYPIKEYLIQVKASV